ncbi:unnamed protein product [Rhizophagus irregularis]|nr:unnamed protein product [Rhizophagus irregularis]
MDFSKEYFKIRSGGLPKNGKPKDSQVQEGFRRTKTQRFTFGVSGGLPKNGKTQRFTFGVSGGLPKNGKTQRFTIGWASLFRRTEKTKIRKIGWASVFRKMGKFQDSIGWASDLREKRNQDSIGWASDLREKRNQDSIGWASDLREKRNQDSYLRILDRVGFRPSGKEEPRFASSWLPIFGKSGTKIRLRCLGCLSKNGKNQRFVSSGGLPKNDQRFIYTNT